MKTAILLTDLGTPNPINKQQTRIFLNNLLNSPEIIPMPKISWNILLKTIILPAKTSKLTSQYQQIAIENTSPLLYFGTILTKKLEQHTNIPSYFAMQHASPSITETLQNLQHKYQKLIALPLYPQDTPFTSAAASNLIQKHWNATLHIPKPFGTNDHYIAILANHIQQHLLPYTQHIIYAFHSLPLSMKPQSYADECNVISQKLHAYIQKPYSLSYQSKNGIGKWLQPLMKPTLKKLATQNIENIAIVPTSFTLDCLETLHELNISNRKLWKTLKPNGNFQVIPALNDNNDFIDFIATYSLN